MTPLVDPASVAPTSLRLWLRPEDLAEDGGCAIGAPITEWRNSAPGAANEPLALDAAALLHAPPERAVDAVSGSCVARFTAARGTLLSVPALDLSTAGGAYSITIVARQRRSANAAVLGQFFANPAGIFFVGWWNGQQDTAMSNSAWLQRGGGLTGITDSLHTLYTLTASGASGELFKFGASVLRGPLAGGPRGITLGGRLDGNDNLNSPYELSDCDVAEVLVHDGVLSPADRQQLEGYLARKYHFSHRLIASHPALSLVLPPPFVWAGITPGVPVAPLLWLRPEAFQQDAAQLASGSVFHVTQWPNAPVATGAASLSANAWWAHSPTLNHDGSSSSSLPFLRFTAAGSTNMHVPLPEQGAYTLFVVGRMWGATHGRLLSSAAGSDVIFGWHSGHMGVFHNDGWVAYPGASPSSALGRWQGFAFSRSTADPAAAVNTMYDANGAVVATALGRGQFSGLFLGRNIWGGELSDGDIAEIIVYNHTLADADRLSVQVYLAQRYSISVSAASAPLNSPAPTASGTSSATPSELTSGTPSPTATASALRCAVSESFASGALPASWVASPSELVSVVTSSPARGEFGSPVGDPTGVGAPFAYLLSGAVRAPTTLTFTFEAMTANATLSADVLFDAGDEAPFVAVSSVGAALIEAAAPATICAVAVAEGDWATATCPSGMVVTDVLFASYGTPAFAGCADAAYSACHAPASEAVVAAACVGRATCSVQKLAAIFEAGSLSCTAGATTSLAFVAHCADPIPGVFSASIASVGAYSQTGWRRVSQVMPGPGRYSVSFAVRADTRADAARASAFAVANVEVCLSSVSAPTALPTPTPLPSASPPPAAPPAEAGCLPLLAAGAAHACGVTREALLLCWGSNSAGQAAVPESLVFTPVTTVATGSYHTCMLRRNGSSVACFGSNSRGQLNVPSRLASGAAPALAVVAGEDFTCALGAVGGAVSCWGSNDYGKATPPAAAQRGVRALSASVHAVCAVTGSFSVVCWGKAPAVPTGVRAARVDVGPGGLVCTLQLDSSLFCWGAAGVNISVASLVTAVASGFFVRYISEGSLFSWPPSVLSGRDKSSSVAAVVSGHSFICTQTTDGLVTCTEGSASPPGTQPFALPCFATSSVTAPVQTTACSIGSASAPATSCSEFSPMCGADAQLVWLRRNNATYQTVCAGGFALAATVDGASDVFRFDSNLWTSSDPLAPSSLTVADFLSSNAKTLAFSDTNAAFIVLANSAAGSELILASGAAAPLSTLFAGGFTEVRLALGAGSNARDWWPLVPLSPNGWASCNYAGINNGLRGPLRLGIVLNNENDCGSPDVWIGVGMAGWPYAGTTHNGCCGNPTIVSTMSIFVSEGLPQAAIAVSATASASATKSTGASPSVTGSARGSASRTSSPAATRSATGSRTRSPTPTRTPTSSLSLRATASSTVTPSRTPSVSATASVSPYCAVEQYTYLKGTEVIGDTALGAAVASSERDCARACCDVPACDAYSFALWPLAPGSAQPNCFFVGNVTYLFRTHTYNSGVNVRTL